MHRWSFGGASSHPIPSERTRHRLILIVPMECQAIATADTGFLHVALCRRSRRLKSSRKNPEQGGGNHLRDAVVYSLTSAWAAPHLDRMSVSVFHNYIQIRDFFCHRCIKLSFLVRSLPSRSNVRRETLILWSVSCTKGMDESLLIFLPNGFTQAFQIIPHFLQAFKQ